MASTNSVAVSAARTAGASRRSGTAARRRRRRRTSTTSVRTGIHCRRRVEAGPGDQRVAHPPHTMCPIRSTCSRLVRRARRRRAAVITPSRMTRTVWLRPIVSSSVSEVRMTAMPSARDGAHQLVDLLLGADVEAAGRMVEDQDARAGLQPLGEHHLLLVAAREVEAQRVDAGRADAQARRPSSAARRRSGRVSIRPSGAARAQARQRDVGGDRQEQHQALGAALARDVADAVVDRVGRASRARAACRRS